MSVRDSVRHVQGSALGREPVRGGSRAVSGRGPGPSWTEGCSGISPWPGAYECRGATLRLRPLRCPAPLPVPRPVLRRRGRGATGRGRAGPLAHWRESSSSTFKPLRRTCAVHWCSYSLFPKKSLIYAHVLLGMHGPRLWLSESTDSQLIFPPPASSQ